MLKKTQGRAESGISLIVTILWLFAFSSLAWADTPAPPTSLSTISGNAQASLKWHPSSGATEYVIWRSGTSGGPYGYIGRTVVNGFADHGLTNGSTYYYVVSSLAGETQSDYSSEAAATPTSTVLKAPAGVTAIPGNGEISITWNAVTSAVEYNVHRISPDGEYTLLTPAAQGLSYTDRGLVNGTQYHYVVQTLSTNPGSYSDAVAAVPSALLPVAPQPLMGSPGSTWAGLSWGESEGAEYYVVYRATGIGGPYAFRAAPIDPALDDTGLANGTTYYYVVSAVNQHGRSAFSPEFAAPVSATQPPQSPVLSATAGNKTVYLDWNDAPGAVSYLVYRSETAGGPYTELVAGTGSAYNDGGLVNGNTYYYKVTSHNASATVAVSNVVSATPSEQLETPTGVAVVPGNTQATLIWNPVTGATQYRVEVAESPGGGAIQSAYRSGLSCTFGSLINDRTYYFRVRVQSPVYSAFSTDVSTTPSAALPLAPTSLWCAPGNTQLSLGWLEVEGATSYRVYRRTQTSPWSVEPIATPAGNYFTDSGLTNGVTYYYIIAVVNAVGAGAFSEISGAPNVYYTPAPTSLSLVPGNMQATLTWNPVAGATQYRIDVAESPGGGAIQSTTRSGLSCTFGGLTNGRNYYFRVRVDQPVDSAFAGDVETTPSVELPLAPTSLWCAPGNTQLSMGGAEVEGATSYRVYRRTQTSPWSAGPIATPAGNYFTDSGLTNGVTYYYIIAAVNAVGAGAFSEVSGTPNARNAHAPTGLAMIPGNTQATLTWDPVVDATQYRIEVAESPGGPAIQYTTRSGLSCTFGGLTNGETYYFRVRTDIPADSAFAGDMQATPSVDLPFAPASINISVTGNTQVSLTWTAVEGATSYRVYRRTQNSAWSPTPVGTPVGNFFTDTGLTNGVKYYYTVVAVNPAGIGAWSGETSSTPQDIVTLAPAGVALSHCYASTTITWLPVAGASRYRIMRATAPNGPYTITYLNNETVYRPADLALNQTYYFYLQADNGANQWSAYSAVVDTGPVDLDSDDDGIPDILEDLNQNRLVDAGETDPCNVDSDGDGIQDGTELGMTSGVPDTDLGVFIPDTDPATKTDALNPDTDRDGLQDGDEDKNANGRVDPEETDPNKSDRKGEFYVIPVPGGRAAVIYLE